MLLGLLSIVPIPWLRRLIGWLIELLMGTIGQSYALKNSAIRRNAMVQRVARDLEWMSLKCQRIAIISHSQGAEVARLLFQAQRRPKVCRWITLGAGIVPLNMLEQEFLTSSKVWPLRITVWGCTLMMLSVLALWLLGSVYGHLWANHPLVVSIAVQPFKAYLVVARFFLLILCWGPPYLYMMGVLFLNKLADKPYETTFLEYIIKSIKIRFSLLPTQVWYDYYASNDPVSELMAGVRVDKSKKYLIFNTRFSFLDHTTYFRNWEQFVAHVALDLFELAGLGRSLHTCWLLLRASKYREKFTWYWMALRFVFLMAFIAAFHYGVFSDHGQDWSELARRVWSQSEGWCPTIKKMWSTGLISTVLIDLRLAFLIAVLYVPVHFYFAMTEKKSKNKLVNDLSGVLLKKRNFGGPPMGNPCSTDASPPS
jgi:hypothetical protein